jgi:hypothetical protein
LSKIDDFTKDAIRNDDGHNLVSKKAARRVVTRSPHRSVGIMACSWVQDRGIEYESQLERRFLQRALVFPHLKEIFHQPFRIDYFELDEPRSYIPDFLLCFKDGSKIVVEVKPAVFINKNRGKLNAAKSLLSPKSVPFLAITDKEIDSGTAARGAALLLRYARGAISDQSRSRCMHLIHAQSNALALGALMAKADVSLGDVLHLIARGHLSIPSSLSIDSTTPVTLTNQEEKNVPLCFCNWFNATPW